ncbi:P-loop NTPase fold protein [Saccharothrix variisporea]|uniref:P-loop NTPase fold protein n=1 Tax=Saccharothrix variisporea TaxID=543527 RepID=UPI0014778102|nr:P-loop NTPase fold protein [Saccharothrix variisporea]
MDLALAAPGSRAVIVHSLPHAKRLGRALVERCGLEHEPTYITDHRALSAVAEDVTGGLFVYAPETPGYLGALNEVLEGNRRTVSVVVLEGPGSRGLRLFETLVGPPNTAVLCREQIAEHLLRNLPTSPNAKVPTLRELAAEAGCRFETTGEANTVALASSGFIRSRQEWSYPLGAPVVGLDWYLGDSGVELVVAAGAVQNLRYPTRASTWRFDPPSAPVALGTAVRSGPSASVVVVLEDGTVHVIAARSGTQRSLGRVANAGPHIAVLNATSEPRLDLDSGGNAVVDLDQQFHLAATGLPARAVASGLRGPVIADGQGRLWHEQRELGEHPGPVTALAASGSRVVSAGTRSSIVLWDLDLGREVRRWNGHRSVASALSWMTLPDGREFVVSASEVGSVRVWDPETGEGVRAFNTGGRVRALAVFPGEDGAPRVATGGDDGFVRVWDPGFAQSTRLGPVVTRGFGDHVSPVDLLDRAGLVNAMAAALEPDLGDEPGPTVLTVEGPWGSGKSTLLDFVRQRLTTAPRPPAQELRRLRVFAADRLLRRPLSATPDQPLPPVRASLVATFNPWRHQSSEQVWAGLAQAVTRAAEDALFPDRDSRERYWFTRNAGRIDRRSTQRELWRRIRSPFLAVGVLGLALSVVAQFGKLPIPGFWQVAAPAVPFAIGLLHTAKRYLWDRASAFLPGELFAGPVRSGAFASGGGDPSVRDPYCNARSGYLYLVQHDVTELLTDVARRGYQVVVFVDDLDRCTPKTTAEVFEAINVFLSDTLPRTRFVLGVDPTVVAAHVDRAYQDLADAAVVAHPDDPSPGWTFLRKLVQLPVRLPRIDHLDRVLDAHLGPVHETRETPPPVADPLPPTTAPPAATPPANASPTAGSPTAAPEPPDPGPQPSTPEPNPPTPGPRPSTQPTGRPAVVVAVERHPEVRAYLRRRLAAQPEQSVREQKRLINVWQFYLRVLTPAGDEAVPVARTLVVIAELVTRWPAYQHLLRKGLARLAAARDDDVAWGAALAALGFKDARPAANLRALLRDCDVDQVVALADRLL